MFQSSPLLRRARLASTLAVTTLLSAGVWAPAQNLPSPAPPVRGEFDRRGDARRDDFRRGDALRGTVARAYGARSFDLRTDDGRIYRVNTRFGLGLEIGTPVRVMGDLNGQTFDARAITVGDFGPDRDDRYNDGYNNNGGYDNGGYGNGGYDPGAPNYQGQSVILRGRVLRVLSRTDIEVRDDDDGRVYRVRLDRALDGGVREGDRIEARGELNGTTIRADFVTPIGGAVGGGVGGGGYVPDTRNDATFVNFSGPILSIDLNREEARVRAGNGYTYTLRARRATLNNFRVGQTVRVQGNWINQVVEVTQLTRER